MRWLLRVASFLALVPVVAGACSASDSDSKSTGSGGGSGSGGGGTSGDAASCGTCLAGLFTPCVDGQPGPPEKCAGGCVDGVGCTPCSPNGLVCVGNEVHKCSADGMTMDELVEVCDVGNSMVCSQGQCGDACQVAADQPSNVGCEFWAVDLDQQDYGAINDPASAPWGVVLSNASELQANVTIELNEAPVGQPPQPKVVAQISVGPSDLKPVTLPTRELDCGVKPNDYASPGTCLSSNAYRITSSAPIVVYQFNVFENSFSNDASLLLPTNALGKLYRAIGWPAGHPVPAFGIIDRSYVTVVGTQPKTTVKVFPSWRIKGNPPIAATPAGGMIEVEIGPFDVLNLETDDGTMTDDMTTIADLSTTLISATAPVAVFSGVESTSAPGGVVDIPTYSGWDESLTCCLDHLEDQMFPMEALGLSYVITRSPLRSTSSYKEPDVLRFVGVAEPAQVKTTLPPPFDSFELLPGDVKTTWAQDNVTVTTDKPIMVGQILISNNYVDGPFIGDPSLTVFPPIEQYRTEYVVLTPGSWAANYIVISAEAGTQVVLDGSSTVSCPTAPAGTVDGKTYEARTCPVQMGVHVMNGDKPYGIVAYGYGSAGSYAFAGGADVKRIYEPPPVR